MLYDIKGENDLTMNRIWTLFESEGQLASQKISVIIPPYSGIIVVNK